MTSFQLLTEDLQFNNKTMLEFGNKVTKPWGVFKQYFEKLGCKHTSIDLNGKNGALPYDLNLPLPFCNKFDIVTNFGTSEHCTNQYCVWYNATHFVEIGGYLLTSAPAPNSYKGHGKYYPSISFYRQLAKLNGFEIQLFCIGGKKDKKTIRVRMKRITEKQYVFPGMYLISVYDCERVGDYNAKNKKT